MSRHGLLLLSIVLLVLGACGPEQAEYSAAVAETLVAESEAERAEALAVPQVEEVLLPQVEGQEIAAGDFPEFSFAAALGYLPAPGSFGLHCGGVLIAEDWVLTAAHCARDDVLILGNRDLQGNDGERYRIRPQRRFCHRPRNSTTLENDIALINVDRNPPTGGSGITPVSLVANNSWETPNRTVTLAGWGRGITTPNLHRLVVRLQGSTACKQVFPAQVAAQTFCTIHATREARSADSGGPVTIMQNGRRTLVGIMVAVADAPTPNGTPNRHLRLTPYLPWINRVMTGTASASEFDNC